MASTAISAQGSTLRFQNATVSAKTITGATQANPCVVTSTAHGLAVGDIVTISGIVGMTQLNGNTYAISAVTSNTFTLAGVDSTGFTAYTSGGSAAPISMSAVGNVKSYSGFDGQASEIDVSNMASVAKEYRLGLQDFGGFSFELDVDDADTGQQKLRASLAETAQSAKKASLTLPNGKVRIFDALVRSFTESGGVDDVTKGQVQLRITGAVVRY